MSKTVSLDDQVYRDLNDILFRAEQQEKRRLTRSDIVGYLIKFRREAEAMYERLNTTRQVAPGDEGGNHAITT